MIKLALIRHGHTPWNRAGRIQGRSDIPLDAEAKDVLAGYELPDPWRHAALVSSPLLRAVETAELISGRTPVTDPALIEMDWGSWEGKRGIDLLEDPSQDYKHIEDWGWDYRPPGGESPSDVRARVMPWANGLTTDTVAVCHIGIMRVLLALATNWDFDGEAPFRVKRNRLYIIEIKPNSWRHTDEPLRLQERPL